MSLLNIYIQTNIVQTAINIKKKKSIALEKNQ